MRLVSEQELNEAEALFKHHWHMADEEGDAGNRVRRGLIAVINHLFNK
jgi:hypothetical protein